MRTFDASHLPVGREGRFTLENFRFESGETLAQLHVGYVAYGTLNAARDNLLFLLPGTSNLRYSALGHIGPGRAYDTDRYCVVCSDAIGAGTSSKPSDGLGSRFPRYTIRDLVRAQHALMRDGLGLGGAPAAVVAGASMGAFQTLEWVISFPGSTRAAVMLVPGWRAETLFKLTAQRMFEIIALDRHWEDGEYRTAPLEGLRCAGRHYSPWTVSDAYLDVTPRAQVEAEVAANAEWFAEWDAWDIIRRYQASSTHDVTQPFGGDLGRALARVDARVLVLPCAQDRLLGLVGARQIAEGIAGAQCSVIDSLKGHLAWRAVAGSPETQFIAREVRRFLQLP
ncbi:MAG: alpha/beta fold hydrolase [Burkholderiaceae bacterium]|uniref:alpha/beta fold hydrolase n=1 Tax=Hydrogenophaga sp. TaxID=1904254 RepID=UPI00271B0056|nr:alpha/beta fold hydrolase [Hydrogenophaga sp.]MDO8280473.1 alpha/beta fold hydrolase [Burkholderiaceae bacterium]MDO9031038.1 alpha/beta fold hydrolase [Hydrogenophaga sp.]